MQPVNHSAAREILSKMTDSDLVELTTSGQREAAFEQIVKRYRDRIYWTARRMVVAHDDAEDVTQETLISVWNKLSSFRSESGLWAWIYRITTNASLAQLRKIANRRHSPIENCEIDLVDHVRSDDALLASERAVALQRAMKILPPRQRAVFDLRVFGDLKYEEIARMMDRSTGTLKANYHHAVRKVEEAVLSEYAEA